MTDMQGEIQLESLTKRFADVVAVDAIDIDMPGGEFFTMLGPSGCGKTTTLRMIAGFERPSGGRIVLDGVDVAQTPPHKRNVNTVFQSYADPPSAAVLACALVLLVVAARTAPSLVRGRAVRE